MPVSQIFIPIGRRIDTFLRRSDGAENGVVENIFGSNKSSGKPQKVLAFNVTIADTEDLTNYGEKKRNKGKSSAGITEIQSEEQEICRRKKV